MDIDDFLEGATKGDESSAQSVQTDVAQNTASSPEPSAPSSSSAASPSPTSDSTSPSPPTPPSPPSAPAAPASSAPPAVPSPLPAPSSPAAPAVPSSPPPPGSGSTSSSGESSSQPAVAHPPSVHERLTKILSNAAGGKPFFDEYSVIQRESLDRFRKGPQAMPRDILEKIRTANVYAMKMLKKQDASAEEHLEKLAVMAQDIRKFLSDGKLAEASGLYKHMQAEQKSISIRCPIKRNTAQQIMLALYQELLDGMQKQIKNRFSSVYRVFHGCLDRGRSAVRAGNWKEAHIEMQRAHDLFGKLPSDMLIEKNQAYVELTEFYHEMVLSTHLEKLQHQLHQVRGEKPIKVQKSKLAEVPMNNDMPMDVKTSEGDDSSSKRMSGIASTPSSTQDTSKNPSLSSSSESIRAPPSPPSSAVVHLPPAPPKTNGVPPPPPPISANAHMTPPAQPKTSGVPPPPPPISVNAHMTPPAQPKTSGVSPSVTGSTPLAVFPSRGASPQPSSASPVSPPSLNRMSKVAVSSPAVNENSTFGSQTSSYSHEIPKPPAELDGLLLGRRKQ